MQFVGGEVLIAVTLFVVYWICVHSVCWKMK